MRMKMVAAVLAAGLVGCSGAQQSAVLPHHMDMAKDYAGFDRNLYPGDDALPELHKRFAFAGYWLNNPPGAHANTWVGKRDVMRKAGFGFLVLANGRIDDELQAQKKKGMAADALGRKDAADAIAAARREGFPAGTILFLDQEEGGRLLPEAAQYLFAWTEAVAHSAYKPGAYVSGQASDDGDDGHGHKLTITTAEDIRQQIGKRHLSPIALFVYQDGCPPSNGCTVAPPALKLSGTPGAVAWQYAQSPRRPDATKACVKTYAPDGMCYASPGSKIFVDLNVAGSADPSDGR